MHKNPVVKWTGALLLATFVLTGCDIVGPEKWRNEQEDVSKAQVGWSISQVMTKIGKPTEMRSFEGVRTGWEEWIYPTGSIFIYRLIVKQVVPRDPGSPIPEERKRGSSWIMDEQGRYIDDNDRPRDFQDF